MLLVITALKLIAEMALMVLLGQWLLGLLAGARRESNVVYQALQVAGRPFMVLARVVSPRFVVERHLPLVAIALLALVWLVCTILKIRICLEIGVALCR